MFIYFHLNFIKKVVNDYVDLFYEMEKNDSNSFSKS